ncbi:hypothetical protein ACWY4P_08300 [Streptomyces sp. LZ34]
MPQGPGGPGGRRADRRARPVRAGIGWPRHTALYAAVAAVILSLIVAGNAGAFSQTWAFLDFGAGVLALVSLSSAVLWGLAATDRLILHSKHRLLAQGVHRGAAVAGLLFLVLHVWVKVAESHTSAAAIVVPFADANKPVLIGLGTLAGYLFITAAVTGAVRSSFASAGKSRWRYRWWRALHVAAYPAWCAALIHGLKSGRAAKDWATAGYVMALAAVVITLWIRLATRRAERSERDAIVTGQMNTIGGGQGGGPRRSVPSTPPTAGGASSRDGEPLGASRGWGA